ncbi:MAG: sugar phosphate isomerase/epimerase [Acidobacteria bacterium]|nr:MAG: sugar phosphate isomerase/epimerase [Acidobacteriota bacterium]
MAQTRREFLGVSAAVASAAVISGVRAAERPTTNDISLAAWSINRSFFVGKRWKNLDLPRIVREDFGINGIEFVNQFFENPVLGYLNQLKRNGDSFGVKFVLIMVDGEGDMAAVEKKDRIQAAIAHRKWIDIAHYLGCHAIRCNLGGPRQGWKGDKDLISRSAESFTHLLEYAKGANLNVVIENHGGASSDPAVLVPIMKAVNNPDFGILPDFGNINQGDDHYEVLRQLLPYAKGISVKASWAQDETHPGWDLEKMLRMCMDSGYQGFWGIESAYGRPRGRGAAAPAGQQAQANPTPDQIWEQESKGVRLTKAVIERVVLKKTS